MNRQVQNSWQAQRVVNLHGADFVAGAALCEARGGDFVAGATLCEPPGADFVAGAIQNAFSREIARNAVFFNRRGGSEAGKSSFAERCV